MERFSVCVCARARCCVCVRVHCLMHYISSHSPLVLLEHAKADWSRREIDAGLYREPSPGRVLELGPGAEAEVRGVGGDAGCSPCGVRGMVGREGWVVGAGACGYIWEIRLVWKTKGSNDEIV